VTASKLMKWLPKSFRRPARPAARTALALQTLEAREVPANVFHWVGGNGPGWNTAANWQENAVPTPATTQLQLEFPAGAFSIDNIDNLFVDRITLAGGDSIVLGDGVSLTLNGTASGSQVVASGANSSIGAGDGLNLVGIAAQVDVAGATVLDFNTALTGANGVLRKTGTGTLRLTGDASYTGETQVQDGVLALANTTGGQAVGTGTLIIGDSDAVPAEVRLQASNQLPTATPIEIRSDGTLNLNHFDDVIGDVKLAGGALNLLDGNLAIAGLHASATTTLTADPGGHINLLSGQHTIEVDAGKVLTIKAPIRNAGGSVGGITKIGAGELSFQYPDLNDKNTYTGLTIVADGTLSLNDKGFDSAFGGILQIGDASGGLNSAVVRLDADRELPDGATVTLMFDGKLDLNGHADGFASLVMDGGSTVVTGANTLTLSGDITAQNASFLGAGITGTVSLTNAAHNIAVTGPSSLLIIDGKITGAGGFTKSGTGVLALKGAFTNDYAGTTRVITGVLELDHTAGFDAVPHNLIVGNASGDPTTAVVRTKQNAQINDAADVSVAGGRFELGGASEFIHGMTFGGANGGGQVDTGVGTLTLGGNVVSDASATPSTVVGKLSLGNASRTFTVAEGAADADLRIDAVISAGGLVKAGAGSLLLLGDNVYTGDTFVNAGTLRVGGSQPNSDVFVNGGVFNPTGAVGNVTATAGTIAPGEPEPGDAATKNFVAGPSALAIDLFTPTVFDQLQVTGAVNLTGSTLAVHRASGAFATPPVVGETFKIIDNLQANPVVGTFNGLADGATLVADGVTYQINYHGGDGNDVTLTALSVPVVVVPPPAVTTEPYAVGAGSAGGNVVRVFNPDGSLKVEVAAFEGNVSGGVRTADADVTGDGVPDLIVGTGPGTVAEVRVYDGATGQRLSTTLPFADFQGGVFVAAADFNNDGFADVVITPDEGGGPRVSVYSGKDGSVLANFFAIDDANFRGGARASAGDVNGDGTPDLVVSAGFGGGPRIAVYDGKSLGGTPTKLMNDFFAFEQALRNGAYVAAGDLNGDGKADLIFGGGPGGGPRVLALDSVKLMQGDMAGATLANFFAGNPDNRGGVRVTAKNLDGDAMTDLVVGDGVGAGSHVTGYLGKNLGAGTPPAQASFDAFPGFLGGVFVG
jgi:autotransporter-associated beta strand protein